MKARIEEGIDSRSRAKTQHAAQASANTPAVPTGGWRFGDLTAFFMNFSRTDRINLTRHREAKFGPVSLTTTAAGLLLG
jgi:hypothetical protein